MWRTSLVSNGCWIRSGNPFTNTYDPAGKRVLQYSVNASYGCWTLYFYSITGQRLATYHLYYVTGTPDNANDEHVPSAAGCWRRWTGWAACEATPTGRSHLFPGGARRRNSRPVYDAGRHRQIRDLYFRDGTTNGAGQDYANARYLQQQLR